MSAWPSIVPSVSCGIPMAWEPGKIWSGTKMWSLHRPSRVERWVTSLCLLSGWPGVVTAKTGTWAPTWQDVVFNQHMETRWRHQHNKILPFFCCSGLKHFCCLNVWSDWNKTESLLLSYWCFFSNQINSNLDFHGMELITLTDQVNAKKWSDFNLLFMCSFLNVIKMLISPNDSC